MELDDVDRALLALLVEDGRRSVNALADEVNLSRASVYRRLDRLRDDGVLTGTSARLDPTAVGWGVNALVMVDVDQGSWRDLRDQLLQLDGLEYLAMTTGRFDFLLRLRARSAQTLRDTVLEALASNPAVRATETVFILEEVARPTRPAPRPTA